MVKYYLKLQNKILVKNLLFWTTTLVLGFNLIVRIWPGTFIKDPVLKPIIRQVPPIALFNYCDGYLLVLFLILIIFLIGTDFDNSMEEIGLIAGGYSFNKFILNKIAAILMLYGTLYVVTFLNFYNLYIQLDLIKQIISLKEILFYSFTTNLFVISLTLFLLFLFRDTLVTVSVITAFYLIEEFLWRCKLTQTKGILAHVYQYFSYMNNEIYKVKIAYIIASIILLFGALILSKRKLGAKRSKK